MAVLIHFESSSGRRRQCNSRCHNAKGPECTCICGGHYHGAARNGNLQQKMAEFQSQLVAKLVQEGGKIKAQLVLA